MVDSFRAYDSNAEKEIAKFLDKNLYSKAEFSDFIRFIDRDNQLKGKDVSFSLGELKNIIVDEKAQIYYVNKNLPTFAFEIDFLSKAGSLTEGWLFDFNKETQYYMIIWITAKKERNFLAEDIIKLECILIPRKRILEFLESKTLGKSRCFEISKNLRAENKEGPSHKNEFDSSCYFYFTPKLAEAPVNIIIYKDKLKELSAKIFEVKNTA